LICWIFLKGCF
jgi:prephenate dehydratase